jgi:mono/diheme cytochrome c family protein
MRLFGILVLATLAALSPADRLDAAPTAEQRAEILALGTLLTRAGNLYTAQKFAEAGETIEEVQVRLAKLADGADEQFLRQLQPLHKRLVRAHALLELEGISLPALKMLESPAEAKPGDRPADAGGPGTVSFVRQVAPILNSRCGNCHVRNARGMFSMATFESLMKGPPAGKVLFAGNAAGSDLIVKIEDKEMPPNGAGIPEAELATLKKWVEEGARFDGPSPTAHSPRCFRARPPRPPWSRSSRRPARRR